MGQSESSIFFANRACEYFPCHEDVDPDGFNCLFCFCPLYTLGPNCGGAFTYTKDGVKSCAKCSLPHQGTHGNAMVKDRFRDLVKIASVSEAKLAAASTSESKSTPESKLTSASIASAL